MVEDGEPEWLPDDRDVVDLYLDEQKHRCDMGHYPWQEAQVEGLEPGYQVCPLCAEMGPYKEFVRKQNHERGREEHGLMFAWYPPREDEDGN